jgi:hypothetical protein
VPAAPALTRTQNHEAHRIGTLHAVFPFAVLVAAIVAQEAQESVGSGVGRWWLLVAGLAGATLACAFAWLLVKRRTLPPAKRPYVPPDLPLKSELTQQ